MDFRRKCAKIGHFSESEVNLVVFREIDPYKINLDFFRPHHRSYRIEIHMIWYINLQISKIIFSHSFYFNYYIFTFSELGSAWIALILVPSCSANFSGYKTGGALFFFDKSVFLNHSIGKRPADLMQLC